MKNEEKVIETIDLTKVYGKERGISGISLSVMKGDIFGFIGPNGAGKSTTIRALMGLLFPSSGSIKIFGKDNRREGADLRRRIGFVPSEMNYYDGLTVKRFLQYSADLYGKDSKSRIEGLSERLKLDPKRKISDLSLGNRKKVALVQALIHKPELLILDEPTSGLDPLIQSRFYDLLKEEQERGCTIFFSSHTLSEVERLCSRVAIIREGEIVNVSSMEELRRMNLKKFRIIQSRGQLIPESVLDGVVQVKTTDSVMEGLFSGNIRNFLGQLSELPVEDVAIEDPNLEEIFMHYYKD